MDDEAQCGGGHTNSNMTLSKPHRGNLQARVAYDSRSLDPCRECGLVQASELNGWCLKPTPPPRPPSSPPLSIAPAFADAAAQPATASPLPPPPSPPQPILRCQTIFALPY